MSINLEKGQKISLSKEAPGTQKFLVGLGWLQNPAFDLDVQAWALNSNEKLIEQPGFVFYNNPFSTDRAIVHSGDNRDGAGDGDDEVLFIDCSKIDPQVAQILFTVTIHEAATKKQNFGQVKDSYVRLIDASTVTVTNDNALLDQYRQETVAGNGGTATQTINKTLRDAAIAGNEIAKYELSEEASTGSALVFCRFYQHNGQWKFDAVGESYVADLAALVAQYQ